MYEKFFKRLIDFVLSFVAFAILLPFIVIFTITGAVMMKGSPFFTQQRPGKNEKIFNLIKFRTMSNAKDKDGNLLPDEKRLNGYGKFLRKTSIDELPELINIIKGDMSIVGPRPLLVRDMVFMTDEERKRHDVRPGLTGLAQCSGRNNMSWEKKFEYDLQYIEKITFGKDVKIVFITALKVLKEEGITEEGMATAMDLGDYLLSKGKIEKAQYDERQDEAKEILKA